MPVSDRRVVIIGAGAAGTAVAASLRRRDRHLEVAMVDPATEHHYQPGFTLVGAGCFPRHRATRPRRDCLPAGVRWIPQSVAEVRPEHNRVTLSGGGTLDYDALVVCPGVELDWQRIDGVFETLGRNGVCSNYSPDTVGYTWQCLSRLEHGRALFTQPEMPIKCPGAPQKIAYLAADRRRRRGLAGLDIRFHLAADTLFGVGAYVPALERVAAGYGLDVRYRSRLVAVDGAAHEAHFEVTGEDGAVHRHRERFDMLHVVPPQRAPAFVREGPLADAGGWVEVDPDTLRHRRYGNVFGLGDAGSTPNSKTAAAVRFQAPVVAANLMDVLNGRAPGAAYDGYAACPITTSYGKVLLAEFVYGGRPTPTFPGRFDAPRRSMWLLKRRFLPWMYWNMLLTAREWTPRHRAERAERPAPGAI
ncbi:MAG TPA: FAD/NAD(P)-binding oxidoreductase [Gammaproteobacteria bacterium]|nr:FAD/NAD(P)-binding oxidoreductase [Gammaproteobacteria bacterium]